MPAEHDWKPLIKMGDRPVGDTEYCDICDLRKQTFGGIPKRVYYSSPSEDPFNIIREMPPCTPSLIHLAKRYLEGKK